MAIIGATAGATITTGRVDSASNWVSELFSGGAPTRSTAEIVTDQLFRNVRHGDFWEGRSTLSPSSRRYLVQHFNEYDPLQAHGANLLPQEPVLSPTELALATPIYEGNRVTVLGRIRIDSIGGLLPTKSRARMRNGRLTAAAHNVTYIAQIAGPVNNRSPLAYVEYASPEFPPPPSGQWVLVVGVPIASGEISLNFGGFVPGVYIVAGSIEPVRGPRSALRFVHRLEVKLNRSRKRCQPHPSTWLCKRIKRTTGRL